MTTVTTTPTQLPPGIYSIVVASVQDGKLDSNRLTDAGEGHVTIHPVGVIDSSKQEWRIDHSSDGKNIIIGRPSDLKWPAPFLTHEGPLEEGSLIKVQVCDFPPNEWRLKPVLESNSLTFKILVGDSDLGMKIFPLVNYINPPPDVALELSAKDQEEWAFGFVREK